MLIIGACFVMLCSVEECCCCLKKKSDFMVVLYELSFLELVGEQELTSHSPKQDI